MPNRILKETIRLSEKLNRLTDFEFRLWVYLITYVDDYGRGDARPSVIKGFCFPLREKLALKEIESALIALEENGNIGLYKVKGKPYLYFPNWGVHQRIQRKVSKFPSPEDDESTVVHGESRWPTVDYGDSPPESNPIQSKTNPNPIRNICTAASAAQVATLTLLDGSVFVLTEDDEEKDRKAYPAVDVVAEYQKMSRWLEANPKNRKTKSGIKRFVNSWLSRAQNSARASTGAKTKTVSAQNYGQRSYTENELLSVSDDLLEEARKRRANEGDGLSRSETEPI